MFYSQYGINILLALQAKVYQEFFTNLPLFEKRFEIGCCNTENTWINDFEMIEGLGIKFNCSRS